MPTFGRNLDAPMIRVTLYIGYEYELINESKSLLLTMVGNEQKVELIENEEKQEYDIRVKGRSFSLLRAT